MQKRQKNKFIKDKRIEMGLAQKDLATRLQVRQQTVSDWETGRFKPNFSNIKALARIFGMNYKDLIDEVLD